MEFDAYTLDAGVYDELFEAAGAPHPHCRDLHDWLRRLSAQEVGGIQEWVTRSFLNEGITFTVYGEGEAEERIIPIDCLPRIVSAADWRLIETGLQQRILALNRFLADIYAEGRIVEDGVVPADMVYDCPQYRREMRGVRPAHGTWVSICGTDIVRTTDGFHVLEDNLRVPSGVSYMIANRKAMKSCLRRLYRLCRVREVEDYGRLLLGHAARDRAGGPHRSDGRGADARRRQRGLLRAHVPGRRAGRGAGRGGATCWCATTSCT